jgi:hypothetical protein
MKTVFSNSREVAHVWASRSQSYGRASNMYFENGVIYSYGRHYPLGLFMENKKGELAVLINAAGYSVTTSKHIAQARGAVSHFKRYEVESTDLMQSIVSAFTLRINYAEAVKACNAAIVRRVERLGRALANDTKKRKGATLEKWQGEAAAYCGNLASIIEFLGGKCDAAARKAMASLGGSPEQLKEQAEKIKAAEARKKAKAQKELEKKNAVLIEYALKEFLSGGDRFQTPDKNNHSALHTLQYLTNKIYMRVIEDNGEKVVETSKGARFPLAHGLRALPTIRAIVASGETWQRNGKTIHLGHYQIDKIGEGVIVAGCHMLPISEVERLAASLGV